MTFDANQVRALSGKLIALHFKHRQAVGGMTLAYIEGWHAIAEANRIFGYDAWDRQTMTLKCVWEGRRGNLEACSYIVRVRIKVRAGENVICREGCGSGHGSGPIRGEAHESAIKEAETDAMKRALATFGNPFEAAVIAFHCHRRAPDRGEGASRGCRAWTRARRSCRAGDLTVDCKRRGCLSAHSGLSDHIGSSSAQRASVVTCRQYPLISLSARV